MLVRQRPQVRTDSKPDPLLIFIVNGRQSQPIKEAIYNENRAYLLICYYMSIQVGMEIKGNLAKPANT